MTARLEYITQKQIYVPEGKNYLAIFYSAVFLQVFFANLYNISLFNELIFIRNFSYSIIGLSSSIYAFAYLFGPYLFRNVVKKIGIQRSLRFIIISSMVYLFILLIVINPVILIVINIIDGSINAVFWSNITYTISSWQKIRSQNKSNNILRNFGLSWNLGALLAQITGYFAILFGLGDYQLRIISWILGLGQIPLFMLIRIPDFQLNANDATENSSLKTYKKAQRPADHLSYYKMIIYPVAFMLIGELIFQISKSLYAFVVPFLIYSDPNASMLIYLTTFLQQITQIAAIILLTQYSLSNKFKGFIAGILGNILVAFSIGSNFGMTGMIFLLIIMASIGFFGGLIYVFSSQLLVEYNLVTQDLKYSSIYETISGLGFGITPLIVGIYIEHYMIQILRGFGALLFVILVVVLFQNQNLGEKSTELINNEFESVRNISIQDLISFNTSARTTVIKYVPFSNSKIRFNEGDLWPSSHKLLINQSHLT